MPRAVPGAALALATCALLALPPSAARAGGFGIPEQGVRRTAMGAVIGRPDEPAAVYHNPAGLTLLPGWRVYASMGVSVLGVRFRMRPWDRSDQYLDEPVDGDGYYPAQEPSRALGVIPMVVVTGELVPDRWFGALSLYVNNATGAAFDDDALTRYHLIDGYIVAPLVEASVAYRVSPRLSVAAGLGVNHVRLHGRRDVYPILMGADLSTLLGSNARLTIDGSDWVPAWKVGVLAAPHDRVTVGAAVIGRADPVLEGPITLRYGDDATGDPGFTFRGTARTQQLLPWTFHAGANVDVTDHVEVGADVRYWLYRQYDTQRTEIDDIFLIQELVTVKDYRDSYQVSGGVRVHDLPGAPGLELMAGAHKDRTPAPARTVTLDQPTFSHVGVRGGLRYAFGRHRLGLSYAHYWYDVPTIEDSITSPPSNIDGHGDNDIVTVSFEAELGAPRRGDR